MNNDIYTPTVIRNPLGSELDPSLMPPDIKGAFHDSDDFGLVPISMLTAPIVIDFVVWDGARPGYTYQLVYDTKTTGSLKVISDDAIAGDPITLEIETQLLSREGEHTVAYEVTNPANQVSKTSPAFTLIIDKTPPGAPELASIQFPKEIEGGLTSAELAALGGVLPAHVAGYTGMAKHDLIKTYWGDIPGPEAVVNESDVGLDEVKLEFSREFLDSIGEEPHVVKYQVFDRAGNPSMLSNPATVVLKLRDAPTDFPAPVIDEGVGSLIDFNEAQTGIRVDIPHYPDASAFDSIRLYWGETRMTSVEISPGDESNDIVLSLRVPFKTIETFPEGMVQVSYEVWRADQIVGSSLDSMIEVFLTRPVVAPISAIVVKGTSVSGPNIEDNFIDEDDYELSARGLIKWNMDLQNGDDIDLHWGDQVEAQWYQIKASDVTAARELNIPISNEIIKAQGTGAEIPVSFKISRFGNPNATSSPVQLVVVRSKEELPGGPDGLEGPTFNLTTTGVLGPNENPDGADVTIPPYVNISRDQLVTLTFKGFDDFNNPIDAASFTASRRIDDDDIANGYVFTVPHRNVRTICTGFAEATFKVEPSEGSNQSPANSKTTRVIVNMLDPAEITCSL
jgi:hypothetical protein